MEVVPLSVNNGLNAVAIFELPAAGGGALCVHWLAVVVLLLCSLKFNPLRGGSGASTRIGTSQLKSRHHLSLVVGPDA